MADHGSKFHTVTHSSMQISQLVSSSKQPSMWDISSAKAWAFAFLSVECNELDESLFAEDGCDSDFDTSRGSLSDILPLYQLNAPQTVSPGDPCPPFL